MAIAVLIYTKRILEKVSFDVKLFCKELQKALKDLLPSEKEALRLWLLDFTKEKPDLKVCFSYFN